MMRTEMVLEKLVYLPFKHLTHLLDWVYFIELWIFLALYFMPGTNGLCNEPYVRIFVVVNLGIMESIKIIICDEWILLTIFSMDSKYQMLSISIRYIWKISCDFLIVLQLNFSWLSTLCRIGLCSQYFRGTCHIQCQGQSKYNNSANILYPAYRPLQPHANT